jgi:IS30 family transposase
VKRNTGLRGYRPKQAQEITQQRQKSKSRHIKLTANVQVLVADNIKQEWSPEQIKDRLKRGGLSMIMPRLFTGLFSKIKPLEVNFTNIFAIEKCIKVAWDPLRLEVK